MSKLFSGTCANDQVPYTLSSHTKSAGQKSLLGQLIPERNLPCQTLLSVDCFALGKVMMDIGLMKWLVALE